jgi:hypothetical protein
MVRVVGVDPGLKGGLAFAEISADGASYAEFDAISTPVIAAGEKEILGFGAPDVRSIRAALRRWRPDFVILEHVGTDDKFGARQAWTFGVGFGALIGAIHASFDDDIRRIVLVRPQAWMKTFSRGKDKDRSITDARSFFPGVNFKGDGPAEALLLIEHFRRAILPTGEVETI